MCHRFAAAATAVGWSVVRNLLLCQKTRKPDTRITVLFPSIVYYYVFYIHLVEKKPTSIVQPPVGHIILNIIIIRRLTHETIKLYTNIDIRNENNIMYTTAWFSRIIIINYCF